MVQKLSSLRGWLQRGGGPPQKLRLATSKIEYVSKTDLFRDLEHGELMDVERLTVMRTCPPGTVFHEPGQSLEVLFILKRGHVNLADRAGTSRETVTRILDDWRLNGTIELERMHIRLLDRDALERLTGR